MKLDRKNKIILNSKIEEIHSILLFLEKEYGLDFVLSLTSKDPFIPIKEEIKEIYTNENIKIKSLNSLSYEAARRAIKKNWLDELLSKGMILVECIEDNNKPDELPELSWIKTGQVYFVGEIIYTKFVTYYQLKDQAGGLSPFLISSRKFRRLFPDDLWN